MPMLALLDLNVQLLNSVNDIVSALKTGRIIYKDGEFAGKFNAKTSKEFLKFAKFDKRKSKWTVLDPGKVPNVIRIASQEAEAEKERVVTDFNQFFDNMEDRVESITPELSFDIAPTVNAVQGQLQKDLATVEVPLFLSEDQKQRIIEDYNQNMSLNIKNWESEQVQRLRNMLTKGVEQGFGKETLKELIEREWKVSANKANFLARQETSLFVSKFRREQSIRAGVNRYKWSTSLDERVRPEDGSIYTQGPNHKRLHGKIFEYGNPPIVDTKKGRKAEPGEDFNCRCVAIPVL